MHIFCGFFQKSFKWRCFLLLVFDVFGQYHWFVATRRRYRVNFTRVGHAWVESAASCLVFTGHQNGLERTGGPVGYWRANYVSLTTFAARLSQVVHNGVTLDLELVKLELWYLRLNVPLEFHVFLHRPHGASVWVRGIHGALHPPTRGTGSVLLSGHMLRYSA